MPHCCDIDTIPDPPREFKQNIRNPLGFFLPTAANFSVDTAPFVPHTQHVSKQVDKQESKQRRTLSVRVVADLDMRVDIRAIAENRTKQAVVAEALEKYLALPVRKAAR